jgi:hypothetical protein
VRVEADGGVMYQLVPWTFALVYMLLTLNVSFYMLDISRAKYAAHAKMASVYMTAVKTSPVNTTPVKTTHGKAIVV